MNELTRRSRRGHGRFTGTSGMSVGILGVSGSTTPIVGSSIAGGAAGLQGNGGARFDGSLAGNGVNGTLHTILIL
jgi:hypothetical protein